MAITPNILAEGQLSATTATTMFDPSTTTYLTHIVFVNTNTVAVTINLYIKNGASTARRQLPVDLSIPAGEAIYWGGRFSLAADDLVQGDASVGAKVDYTVFGGS